MNRHILIGLCFLLFHTKLSGSQRTPSAATTLAHQIEAISCCNRLPQSTISVTQSPSSSSSFEDNNHCFRACIRELRRLVIVHDICWHSTEDQPYRADPNLCSRQMLTTQKHSAILALERGCGKPFVVPQNDGLWDCLLQSEYMSQLDETLLMNETQQNDIKQSKHATLPEQNLNNGFTFDVGMNPLKRFCCDRAELEMCKQLCHKTYSNEYVESSIAFRQYCQHFWDYNLRQCLQDADGVCRYGCESTMNFCSHFNGQFKLFRHCNARADSEAAKTYSKWIKSNMIKNSMVPGIELHFRNMSQCQPDAWRRLACHLHVQPCVSGTHSSNICLSSCVELVRECLNSELSNNVQPEMVCQVLAELDSKTDKINIDSEDFSQHPKKKCIDFVYENQNFKQGFEGASEATPSVQIVDRNVCFQSDCNEHNQICNRPRLPNECFTFGSKNIPQKRCHQTCSLGKLNEWKIVLGDSVLVPSEQFLIFGNVPQNSFPKERSSIKCRCVNICKCVPRQQTTESFSRNNHYERTFDNEQHSLLQPELECYLYCFSNCSKHPSEGTKHISSKNTFVHSVVPDCSAILLQGKNIKFRFCLLTSAESNQLVTNFRQKLHVPSVRLLCFDRNIKNCINIGLPETDLYSSFESTEKLVAQIIHSDDLENSGRIVCDQLGNERSFESIRLVKDARLAYPGPCLSCCSMYGPVCGHDGREYSSECEARSHHVAVDYSFSCSDDKWHCKPIAPGCPSSLRQTVAGTRCPICGSVAYFTIEPFLIYIVPKMDQNHLTQKFGQRLTVPAVVEQLYQLSTVNCQVFAHKPMENLLAVSFVPEYSNDFKLYENRSYLCDLELKRIVTLFDQRSPRIELWFPLKYLHHDAIMDHKLLNISGNHSCKNVMNLLLGLIIILIKFLFIQ